MERAVLTLAIGKPVYFRMAINLARSFCVWHPDNKIKFVLATDCADRLPMDLLKISRVQLEPGQYGTGFSPKLHLDRISPARETLFLDADCLCAGNLERVFDRFRKWDVSVIGREESDGELFGDIAKRCQTVGVPCVPRFCGGIYYFKRGDVSTQVFSKARELERQYDQLGLERLRGAANEEPLIGLAMALANQHSVPEDGSIKAEPMFFSGRTELNVFSGYARLHNLPGTPAPYAEWKIPTEARPTVVHFNCSFAERPPYTTEALRLDKVLRCGWPLPIATAYAWLKCALPFSMVNAAKDVLRPAYHGLFGYRPVKPSGRLKESH